MSEITLIYRKPTVEEYCKLRVAAEWPAFEDSLVEQALANSLFTVVAENQNEVVGMARVTGDGAIYFHVLDVIVKPEYQRKGVGKLLMEAVMTYFSNVGRKSSQLGLMSSKGREKFYTDFGFTIRPNEKAGAGMILVKEK